MILKSLVISVLSGLVMASGAMADERGTQALGSMLDRAQEFGARAAYVFDLDETTVDSSPRRYESLLDAIDEVCTHAAVPHPDCEALRFIKLSDFYRLRNRYDTVAYLHHYGAQDEAFLSEIVNRSFEVYLSGRYIVDKDHLFVGVQNFIKNLKRSGAQVFFVSSRSHEKQGRATLRFLMDRGLIREGEEYLLYLKPDGEESTHFKRRATEEIADRMELIDGRIFGIFENEPENLAIWIDVFPRARAFFVEGAYQHGGTVPTKAVFLEDFRF